MSQCYFGTDSAEIKKYMELPKKNQQQPKPPLPQQQQTQPNTPPTTSFTSISLAISSL